MNPDAMWTESERAIQLHNELDVIGAQFASIIGNSRADLEGQVRAGKFGPELRRLLGVYPTKAVALEYQRIAFEDALYEVREKSIERKVAVAETSKETRSLSRELAAIRQARLELRVKKADPPTPGPEAPKTERVVNAELWGSPAAAPRGGASA